MNRATLKYQGTPSSKNNYLPSLELIEAVNLAIRLERPLLIKGEPGCGKTSVARAVADELDLPYEEWNIKSTSRARDGLYFYDNIARLRDAQLAARDTSVQVPESKRQYVRLGPLGKAFESHKPSVVLIDEIDKADIDFPNDLLLELDRSTFEIIETGEPPVKARHKPIVFITSNDERDLPDAFLRRCLFHYIQFPLKDRLIEIVNAHYPQSDTQLVTEAVARFYKLREDQQEAAEVARKKVSTSELIDWFRILREEDSEGIFESFRKDGLPYPGVLLKSWEDHCRFLPVADAGKDPNE
jgi:MoxR-like ATPase